jgi:hypothetical protein
VSPDPWKTRWQFSPKPEERGMRPKAKKLAEIVSWDLVVLGAIEPRAWPVIASVVAEVIRQDRDSAPRDEEDTLP